MKRQLETAIEATPEWKSQDGAESTPELQGAPELVNANGAGQPAGGKLIDDMPGWCWRARFLERCSRELLSRQIMLSRTADRANPPGARTSGLRRNPHDCWDLTAREQRLSAA